MSVPTEKFKYGLVVLGCWISFSKANHINTLVDSIASFDTLGYEKENSNFGPKIAEDFSIIYITQPPITVTETITETVYYTSAYSSSVYSSINYSSINYFSETYSNRGYIKNHSSASYINTVVDSYTNNSKYSVEASSTSKVYSSAPSPPCFNNKEASNISTSNKTVYIPTITHFPSTQPTTEVKAVYAGESLSGESGNFDPNYQIYQESIITSPNKTYFGDYDSSESFQTKEHKKFTYYTPTLPDLHSEHLQQLVYPSPTLPESESSYAYISSVFPGHSSSRAYEDQLTHLTETPHEFFFESHRPVVPIAYSTKGPGEHHNKSVARLPPLSEAARSSNKSNGTTPRFPVRGKDNQAAFADVPEAEDMYSDENDTDKTDTSGYTNEAYKLNVIASLAVALFSVILFSS